ncbi:MAG: hypothetical protein ABJF79_20580 [Paracoccaceae bacterium]
MKYSISAALLMCCVSSAAFAKQEAWFCNLSDLSDFGFMPSQVAIVMDQETKKATVVDNYGMVFNGGPTAAKLKSRGNDRWRVSWKVRNVETSNAGTVTVSYQADFDRAAKKVTVRGRLANYQNAINGAGRCQEVDPKSLR